MSDGIPCCRAAAGILREAAARPAPEWIETEYTAISTNFRHNDGIRISPVFLIDQNDEKLGPTPTAEALRKAREAGLDLVEVAPMARPPVCKIMDYGKWRYQQQKKQDKSRASVRGGQLKELVLKTVKIGDHDLMIKVNHAREFLKEGNKVQFTLRFKGREMAHLDLGRDIFIKIKQELWLVSKVERDAKMEGRRMTLVLQPDRKAADAKPPVVGGSAPKPVAGPGSTPAVSGTGLNLPPRPAAGGPVGPRPAPPAGAPAAQPMPPAAAPAPARPAAAPPPPRPAAPTTAPARVGATQGS